MGFYGLPTAGWLEHIVSQNRVSSDGDHQEEKSGSLLSTPILSF